MKRTRFPQTIARFLSVLLLIAFSLPFCACEKNIPSAAVREPCTEVLTEAPDRITRVLVLGCDKSRKLTDSILLVAVNETQKRVSVLQIPRDTYAEYTGRDYKKLNGALASLGGKGFCDFLSASFGVPIDGFASLDLSLFGEIVDAVGGVDVELSRDMIYSDPAQGLEIRLPAGRNHLDGGRAEQFVRFRSGYADADLGRLDAQKMFLRAFAERCRTLDAGQYIRVAALAAAGLSTDFPLPEVIRLCTVLRDCDPDDLPMATLSGEAAQGKSGAWYYVLNREGAERMVGEYLMAENTGNFDPAAVFDREENELFHKIYRSPESALPIPY